MITLDRLSQVLSYNQEDGTWIRLVKTGPNAKLGPFTPSMRNDGYTAIKIDGVQILSHRLAWLYVHGEWPKHQIDHINGIKSDNRICNLRDVSASVNQQNQRKPQLGTVTGYLGVYRSGGNFISSITINGKQKALGRFKTAEDAYKSYLAAKREFHEGCTI